ncbi:MAG: ATP-binding protein [Leptolyngbyaceae cyanobacterium]
MTLEPMRHLTQSRFKLPLQWLLIVPFVVQIFAVVGIVGYLSFQNGHQAIDELADSLIYKTNSSVSDHLDSYLSVPQGINRVNADAIRMGILDVNDPEQVTQFFWSQMQAHDLTYIGYGLTSGAGAGVAKYDGETLTLEEWHGELPNNVSNYAADDQGRRAGLNETWDFDNSKEVWYTEPVAAGKPIWSRIFVWTSPGGNPYITASAGRPIYDANDRLLGMIAADIHLLKLSKFLRELHISPSGQIFIMERDGMLIANSGNHAPFELKGQENKIKRINVLESADPIVQGISRELQTRGGWQEVTTGQELKLKLQGERSYVRIEPWQDEFGLDWVVVTVVPESDFMAEIDANTRTTILLCLGALAVATVLGIYTSRRITQPIFKLSQASQILAASARDRFATQQAHVENQAPLTIDLQRAGIQELDALADSFSQMAQQLQQTFVELEALNEGLEDRVELRTRELQATLQELHRTQAQMLQSEKMSALGQMVAGVAHEINNPINFIFGNLTHAQTYVSDLLELIELYQRKQAGVDPEVEERVDSIDLDFMIEDLPKLMESMRIGSERIREIVMSLRTFSRLDEAEFKEADIHDGIDSTLMILQHRTKGKPNQPAIEIVKDYDTLPLIECYPGQLNQVLMNILSNAIDALEEKFALSRKGPIDPSASADKNPMIHIRTRRTAEDAVLISIKDNGPGISADLGDRLFEPFFTTKTVGKGTGMGMAISYEIINQKHRGHLTYTSTLGEGAEFVIKIPIRQAELATAAKQASQHSVTA